MKKLKHYHLLVATCLLVWLGQLAWPPLTALLALHPTRFLEQPWTLFTAMFTHALHPLHIFLNMLSLWFMGRALEKHYPSWWLTVTYLGGGLVGNSTWLLWGPPETVVGASGAIFALLGMALPLTRFHWSVLLLAALNLSLGLLIPQVAWQVHLGGFLAGLLLGLAFAHRVQILNKRTLAAQEDPAS